MRQTRLGQRGEKIWFYHKGVDLGTSDFCKEKLKSWLISLGGRKGAEHDLQAVYVENV